MPTLTRPPRSTPSPADKNANFGDRMNAAAAARKAMLERFHARPSPDDPAVQEQQAARKAVSDAREVRMAERKAAREAEAQRQVSGQAAKAALHSSRTGRAATLACAPAPRGTAAPPA